MRISGGTTEEVEFASTLESEEARDEVSLLDIRLPRNDQFIRMCSWCQRVWANGLWMTVEGAVYALGVMTASTVPAVTHGICEDCRSTMMAKISVLKLAA